MTVFVRDLVFEDVLHVVKNMREQDAREIYGLRWNNEPGEVALEVMSAGKFGWTFGVDDTPIACVGAFTKWPGVLSVWMFSTDDFDKVAISLTKFIKRVMMPAGIQQNIHRHECQSLATHTTAHRWLESMGFEKESVLKSYGRNGEDYINMVWRPDQCV